MFLWGGAIQRGDGPNDVRGASLSRGGKARRVGESVCKESCKSVWFASLVLYMIFASSWPFNSAPSSSFLGCFLEADLRLLTDQCMVELEKRASLVSSKSKGHTKKEQCYLHLVQEKKEPDRPLGSCNWLLRKVWIILNFIRLLRVVFSSHWGSNNNSK